MTIENQIENFRSNFCPYGYTDIKRAIEIANEVGEDENWLFEMMEQVSEECETPLNKIDPVWLAYDVIMQESRNEIDNLTNFDLCNDMPSGSGIEVYGNYYCTCYDYRGDAIQLLTKKLKVKKIKKADLSLKVQWFLEQLEIKIK